MQNKQATTSVPVSELVSGRWSPRVYHPTHEFSPEELIAFVEAARWAPSSNNAQPWKFIVAPRGTPSHSTIVSALTGFNQSWAPSASALIVVLASATKPDGSPFDRGTSMFNAGLAASNIVLEAETRGYKSHFMGGFEKQQLIDAFSIKGFEAAIILAIGLPGDLSAASPELQVREMAPRERKSLDELLVGEF